MTKTRTRLEGKRRRRRRPEQVLSPQQQRLRKVICGSVNFVVIWGWAIIGWHWVGAIYGLVPAIIAAGIGFFYGGFVLDLLI